MSVGGNKSKSSSRSNSRQFIAPAQQQALAQLYGQAQDVNQQVQPELQAQIDRSGGRIFNQGAAAVQGLTGISRGTNPFIQNLMARSQMANPYLDQQIGGLARDIGRFTTEQVQGIGQGFVSAGQFGGSRQGLAEGQAIGRSIDEFAQQAANLRGGDLDRQLQAAQAGAGLQLQAGVAGVPAAQQLFNLGISPALAQFASLQQVAGLLGDPTVLSESESVSKGKGAGFNVGIGGTTGSAA